MLRLCRSHTTPAFSQPFHQSTSSSSFSSFHPSAATLCLVLFFLLSSLLTPTHAILNKALQAGWSPNSNEVIQNGTFISASLEDSIPSWKPFPTLYLWLSDPSMSAVSYRVVATESGNYPYVADIRPAAPLAVNGDYFNVYPIDDPAVEEPAAIASTGGRCLVDRNKDEVQSQFVLDTRDYDDVLITFTHDCDYPRVRVGRPPATDDVIAYSKTRVPNLTPDTSVQLSVAANTGDELQLGVRVVDTEEGQWPHGQSLSFSVDIFSASSDKLRASTLVTPELATPQLVNISTELNELTSAYITVKSTCSDTADSGYIVLSLYLGFLNPMTLPVNITCQPQKKVNPLRSLSVDLVPGSQYVGAAVSRVPIAVNGSVADNSSFNVAASADATYTFAIPQRYVTLSIYNDNYNNRSVTGQVTVSAGNWLVGLSASSAATTTPGSDTFTFSLRSKLTLQIETQCQSSDQLQTTTVVINTIADSVVDYYDPIEFSYQWMCQQPPLFALSTQSLSSGQSTGNLINRGQPANTAGRGWTVDTNSSAGVINVNYNIEGEMSSVVGAAVYLTLQSPSATVFTWSLDSAASYGLSDATFHMSGTPVQSGSTYKQVVPFTSNSTASAALQLDRLVCSKRGYVQVSTRVTYGWVGHVTINFNRHCEQADQFDYTTALSGGAVAAIVLLVLATASCVMGCGWRYSSKGKRGWEMLPCYDVWSRVQDSALGPKRYTGPQMSDDDVDGMVEEVEISSQDGYGSTYQTDL